MTLEGKYKINFLFESLTPKLVVMHPWESSKSLKKKLGAKKSFQLICADKIFKTIKWNFLKMNWSRDI